MTDAITLYDSPGSPCARRVRMAVCRWLERVGRRPSIIRSEGIRPD